MPDTTSTTSFRADISSLKAAMQEAQRQVRLAESEFNKATASMDDWSSSAEGLQAKLKQLTKTLDAQKTRANIAREEWRKAAEEFGENSAEAEKAKIKLNQYEAQVAKTEKEIQNYTQDLDDCKNETGKFAKATDEADKATENATEGFTVMKGALADLVASGIKAAVGAFKNLIGVAKDAYKEFDEGADAVIKATGATGDAAKELEENYNNVAHSVIGNMSDIGSALGEINTRFGFTGDELEDATQSFVKFADITGTDATEAAKLVSRAIENAGMETKDYKGLLDILAKAGQATGVSVSTLAEAVTKNGAQFRQLGYTTEEAIAMLAKFELEGVNSETVLAGMKKAVANWGKEGKDAKEEYQKVLQEIANTEDVAEASAIAIEAFGTKAGPELVEDIQAGKLEYKDFLEVLKTSEGTVTQTYEATKDGFDEITLAIQGGKADLGKFVREIATNYKGNIVKAIDKIKEGIKTAITWVIKNGDLIIETIKSIAKVAATLWAVKKAAAFANTINVVIKAIKGFSVAMKAAEAATTATNAATGILSSLASPGGAIVLGITAVIAVTSSLISIFKEEEKEIDVLTEKEKQSVEASHALKASYDEMDRTRQNAIGAVQNEYGHYEELIKEFDSIVGGNGKVKEGYEDRAQFIMTTLNEALGLEMTMQNGIIENYAKERQAIDELIEKKKAEAVLIATEQAYTEAIQKKTDAAQVYLQAQETFNDVLARAEEKAVELQECYIDLAEIEKNQGVAAAEEYRKSHLHLLDEYEALQVEVTKTRGALHEATDAYEGYNATIKNYEGLSSAIISGDTDKINEAMLKSVANMKDSTNTTADVLKDQVDTFNDNYMRLKKAVEAGDKSVTQQMVDDAKKLRDEAGKEYMRSGGESVAAYTKGIKEETVYAEEAAKNLGFDSYEEFNKSLYDGGTIKTKTSGDNFANGFINAVTGAYKKAYNAAYGMAEQATQGVKDAQDEHSPSKVTTHSGKMFTTGFINGIGSLSAEVIRKVKEIAEDAIETLGGAEYIKDMKAAGQELIGQAAQPLNLGNVQAVRETMPSRANSAGGTTSNVSTVNNNYNLVQNNTSPKPLTALETYRARRQQVALVKALT